MRKGIIHFPDQWTCAHERHLGEDGVNIRLVTLNYKIGVSWYEYVKQVAKHLPNYDQNVSETGLSQVPLNLLRKEVERRYETLEYSASFKEGQR